MTLTFAPSQDVILYPIGCNVKLGSPGRVSDEAAPAMHEDADTGMTVTNDFAETVADVMAPPETPEDYSFEDIKVRYGDDETWDADLEAQMRPIFHAAGLSDVEANGLVNTLIEVQGSTPEQHERMTM